MNLFTFCLLVCTGFINACTTDNKKEEAAATITLFDEKAATDSIWKVIEKETADFFNGDYEGWASNWSHQPYAMQSWNNDDATASAAVGWEKINTQGKDWIEKYYKNGKNIIHPAVKREKALIKFFNDKAAYLTWKQYNADADKKFYRISQEVRLMEKETDGWKIVNVSAFWGTEKKIAADSLKL
ncbi:hypothetical protein [Ferruginibacter sp.]